MAWVRRFRAGGLSAWVDRSRRPDTCPHQTDEVVEALVCELRRAHPRWGPARLAYEPERREVVPVLGCASCTTAKSSSLTEQ